MIVSSRRIAAVLLLVAISACRDRSTAASIAAPAPPTVITPRVSVARSGGDLLLTVSLDLPATVGRLGSVTGRVVYDPARLTFLTEEPLSDGAVRASNPQDGVIRIAAASASGLDAAVVMRLRFRGTDAGTPLFTVDEVHELSRTDVSASLSRRTAGVRP